MENLNMAGEQDIKGNRRNYKVGMYLTLSIIMIIVVWSIISESRWLLFEAGGDRSTFDLCMLFGVIASVVIAMASFFTLGQTVESYSKECSVLGGTFHIEERQIVLIWAIVIGSVLGMGFWDIVTMVNLSFVYGFLNIWTIDVVVYDFGFWQMVFPVWALVIIGVLKMGAVIILYVLAMKNIKRGTICSLAAMDKNAILS